MNVPNAHVAHSVLQCTAYYGQGYTISHSISVRVADVVIAAYETLTTEFSEYGIPKNNGPIFKLVRRRVILNETHTIKSRLTR